MPIVYDAEDVAVERSAVFTGSARRGVDTSTRSIDPLIHRLETLSVEAHMRIIAGTHRGQTIKAPAGSKTRPTTDRVRESLFQHLHSSVLETFWADIDVLDLYAGSGALGLEAVSRGARTATFIEEDARAVRTITENVERLTLSIPCTVLRGTLPLALRYVASGPFHLVFADPPYRITNFESLLEALRQHNLLSPRALIVLEHSARTTLEVDAHFVRVSNRRYGDAAITVLRFGR